MRLVTGAVVAVAALVAASAASADITRRGTTAGLHFANNVTLTKNHSDRFVVTVNGEKETFTFKAP